MPITETTRRFDWLTVEEVRALTGYSKARIHQFIQAGELPVKVLPRLTLIHRADADKLPHKGKQRR